MWSLSLTANLSVYTQSGEKSKKKGDTTHSYVVLRDATQVALGAVLAYDLHFKINFVQVSCSAFFTPAGNWCYCMCINISAPPCVSPPLQCLQGRF